MRPRTHTHTQTHKHTHTHTHSDTRACTQHDAQTQPGTLGTGACIHARVRCACVRTHSIRPHTHTNKHTHTHTHAHKHTRSHSRTHARTNARARAHVYRIMWAAAALTVAVPAAAEECGNFGSGPLLASRILASFSLCLPDDCARRRAAIYSLEQSRPTPSRAPVRARARVGDGRGSGLCRAFNDNAIGGTLPASLSALTKLSYLCAARPTAAAAPNLATAGRTVGADGAHYGRGRGQARWRAARRGCGMRGVRVRGGDGRGCLCAFVLV